MPNTARCTALRCNARLCPVQVAPCSGPRPRPPQAVRGSPSGPRGWHAQPHGHQDCAVRRHWAGGRAHARRLARAACSPAPGPPARGVRQPPGMGPSAACVGSVSRLQGVRQPPAWGPLAACMGSVSRLQGVRQPPPSAAARTRLAHGDADARAALCTMLPALCKQLCAFLPYAADPSGTRSHLLLSHSSYRIPPPSAGAPAAHALPEPRIFNPHLRFPTPRVNFSTRAWVAQPAPGFSTWRARPGSERRARANRAPGAAATPPLLWASTSWPSMAAGGRPAPAVPCPLPPCCLRLDGDGYRPSQAQPGQASRPHRRRPPRLYRSLRAAARPGHAGRLAPPRPRASLPQGTCRALLRSVQLRARTVLRLHILWATPERLACAIRCALLSSRVSTPTHRIGKRLYPALRPGKSSAGRACAARRRLG